MRRTIDMLVEREGENLAIEHHQEEGVTRVANLINKGTVWEKVWAHPTGTRSDVSILAVASKSRALMLEKPTLIVATNHSMPIGKSRDRTFLKSIW